jgi:hypothetical protein
LTKELDRRCLASGSIYKGVWEPNPVRFRRSYLVMANSAVTFSISMTKSAAYLHEFVRKFARCKHFP